MTRAFDSARDGSPTLGPVLRRSRNLLWAVGAVIVAVPLVGHAATLPLSADSLGGASAAIARCDTDGFSIAYATTGGNVTGLTISGIAAACADGRIEATLMGAGTKLATSGSATVSGGSAAVSFLVPPDAELVDGIHVLVSGP